MTGEEAEEDTENMQNRTEGEEEDDPEGHPEVSPASEAVAARAPPREASVEVRRHCLRGPYGTRLITLVCPRPYTSQGVSAV